MRDIKRPIQAVLGKFGYQIQKIREPLPFVEQIHVFSYCMNELLTSKSNKLRILQVGANDGIRADPVFKFITDYQLDAHLLEPVPSTFQLLRRNYASYPNAKLFCAALSDRTGDFDMYIPSEMLLAQNSRLSGLCSSTRELLIAELKGQGYENAQDEVRQIVVPAYSVADFLAEQSIDYLDVLQIDTEGHDWRILSQFDLDALGISLINLEFFHLSEEEQRACLTALGSRGFKVAHTLGDLIAYRHN